MKSHRVMSSATMKNTGKTTTKEKLADATVLYIQLFFFLVIWGSVQI